MSIQKDSGDTGVFFDLSDLLNECGKKHEAIAILENLNRASPRNPQILMKLSQLHLMVGNAAEAQKYLSAYRETAGATLEMYLLLGQTMLARKFFDGAVKNFKEGMKAFPAESRMGLGLGKAYLGMNEKGQALLEFEQALQKKNDDIEVLIELGKLQNQMGMTEQADSTFAKVEGNKQASGDNFLEMARHFAERADLPRAVEYLEKGMELSPYDADIHKALGQVYMRQKRYTDALSVYKSTIETYPSCEWGHEGVIACAAASEDYELKAASQKKMLEISGKDPEKWCDYGETLIRLGKFDDAKDVFESAARLDPSCVRAYQAPDLIKVEKARSEAEKFAKQGEEAIEKKFYLTAVERLEKALELVPGQKNWIRQLAEIACLTADVPRASSLLSQIHSFAPEDAASAVKLSRVYEFENKVQLATELLTSVTKQFPENIDAQINLLRLKRSQIRTARIETEMLDALVKNIDLDLAHIKRNSPVSQLVKAYAWYIFSNGTKIQRDGLNKAAKLFEDVIARFGEIEPAVRGISFVERARSNIEKAVEYTKARVKLSTDSVQILSLARLHENFQQYKEAQECFGSLISLFPENGFYRRKNIEMLAALSRDASQNQLMNFISERHQASQTSSDPWVLYELAAAQEQMASLSAQRDEWIKKALLSWHKALSKFPDNPWIRWEMLRCQFKYIKGNELQRAAAANLKACEKLLREFPDNHEAFLAVGRCYLAYGDLANIDKAFAYLEKAWFLAPQSSEAVILAAKTAKKLGKSVVVDAAAYNMLLLEPELYASMFQL